MSFLINTGPLSWLAGFEDRSLDAVSFQLPSTFADIRDGDPWAPESGLQDGSMLSSAPWEAWGPAGGAASRFGFVGVTRDQWGSPLKGCTVKLFRTSNDVKLDETVSDINTGAFLLNTAFYPDAHYIVTVKAGSPSVQGITVNTLIGS